MNGSEREKGKIEILKDVRNTPSPLSLRALGNKPFCDGTHEKVQFDGTKTASREP